MLRIVLSGIKSWKQQPRSTTGTLHDDDDDEDDDDEILAALSQNITTTSNDVVQNKNKQESLADAKVSARQQCVYEDP